MGSAELELLLSDLQRDPELMEEFRSLADDPEVWVRWASAKSYDITVEEARQLEETYSEIDEADLEQAAGGWSGEDGGG